jgi:hypothetical protein
MKKVSSLSFDIAILDVNLNGRQTFPTAEPLNELGVPLVFATGYGICESSVTAPVRINTTWNEHLVLRWPASGRDSKPRDRLLSKSLDRATRGGYPL